MKKHDSSSGVASVIFRLWAHLSRNRKKQFVLLAILMLIAGFAEAVSLGLVVPFLAAMAAPERLLGHPRFHAWANKVEELCRFFGWEARGFLLSTGSLLLALALLFIAGVLGAGIVRLLLLWASIRLSNGVGTDLGFEVYRRTLYQPYAVHTTRNSSAVISNLTTKVGMAVATFSTCLTLLTSVVVMVSIMAALLSVSPWTTVAAGMVLGLSYASMVLAGNHRLRKNSQIIAREHNHIIKALQEGLGGIRDILLDGTQELYCAIYKKADMRLKRAGAINSVISQSPRYLMETVGMILFAALAVVLSRREEGLLAVLPVLGALALGAQRLLPALQQAYTGWSAILYYHVSTREVVDLLDQPLPRHAEKPGSSTRTMPFRSMIRFDSVKFRYSSHGPWVLDGVSFEIPKGSRVGFVGKTGSGKSTCLDLLMGLLEPTEGRILVDEEPIDAGNLRIWQKNIAHVPQTIYLADTTLAENIAFGVPSQQIDMRRVREVARQAQISDFIESSPHGYQALVGERGIRLSGGQRQRIGIARALYKEAPVLILDEATSALDQETEKNVMNSINSIAQRITVLIIAHRITTLDQCQRMIRLETLSARTKPTKRIEL